MQNKLIIPLFELFEVITSYQTILDYKYKLDINTAFDVQSYYDYLHNIEHCVYDVVYKTQHSDNESFDVTWEKVTLNKFFLEPPTFSLNDIKSILNFMSLEDIETLKKIVKN